MSFFRHPRKSKLERWLDGEDDTKLANHVANCDRCVSVIEEIGNAEADLPGLGSYSLWLDPEDGYKERVEASAAERLDSREVLGIVGGLFAAGFQSTKILVTEEP